MLNRAICFKDSGDRMSIFQTNSLFKKGLFLAIPVPPPSHVSFYTPPPSMLVLTPPPPSLYTFNNAWLNCNSKIDLFVYRIHIHASARTHKHKHERT